MAKAKKAVKKATKKVVKKLKSGVKAAMKPAKGKKVSVTKPKKAISPSQITKPYTKSQIVGFILDQVPALNKRADAAAALDAIIKLIELHLSKKGPGEFNFAGLCKFKLIEKPATKARPGKNPFTGEMITISAKPKRTLVKVRPLRKLKEMVG